MTFCQEAEASFRPSGKYTTNRDRYTTGQFGKGAVSNGERLNWKENI